MKIIYTLVLVLITISSIAQIEPDDILIGNKERPEVLLVGTFHFAYYDQDVYKTDPDKRVDIA